VFGPLLFCLPLGEPVSLWVMSDVTRILDAIKAGQPQAAGELLPLVYDELRKLANAKLAHEKPGQTLDATGLVHEAYLRLVGAGDEPQWNNRGHFFAAAAEAMRRILVENARRKQRIRHGGGRRKLDLDRLNVAAINGFDGDGPDELLALDEALAQLAEHEPAVAKVVRLRYFAGLSVDETAASLEISVRTTNRHWAYARAWLFQQLSS
jgi:RNA polymerase sigma factor (TIGR02999 family)